jgi:hypothetical protein
MQIMTTFSLVLTLIASLLGVSFATYTPPVWEDSATTGSCTINTQYTLEKQQCADYGATYAGVNVPESHGGYCVLMTGECAGALNARYVTNKNYCSSVAKEVYVGPNLASSHGGYCIAIGAPANLVYSFTAYYIQRDDLRHCGTNGVYIGPNSAYSMGGYCVSIIETLPTFENMVGDYEQLYSCLGCASGVYTRSFGVSRTQSTSMTETYSEEIAASIAATVGFTAPPTGGADGSVTVSLSSTQSESVSNTISTSMQSTLISTKTLTCLKRYMYQFRVGGSETVMGTPGVVRIFSGEYVCTDTANPRCPPSFCLNEDCQECINGFVAGALPAAIPRSFGGIRDWDRDREPEQAPDELYIVRVATDWLALVTDQNLALIAALAVVAFLCDLALVIAVWRKFRRARTLSSHTLTYFKTDG